MIASGDTVICKTPRRKAGRRALVLRRHRYIVSRKLPSNKWKLNPIGKLRVTYARRRVDKLEVMWVGGKKEALPTKNFKKVLEGEDYRLVYSDDRKVSAERVSRNIITKFEPGAQVRHLRFRSRTGTVIRNNGRCHLEVQWHKSGALAWVDFTHLNLV